MKMSVCFCRAAEVTHSKEQHNNVLSCGTCPAPRNERGGYFKVFTSWPRGQVAANKISNNFGHGRKAAWPQRIFAEYLNNFKYMLTL